MRFGEANIRSKTTDPSSDVSKFNSVFELWFLPEMLTQAHSKALLKPLVRSQVDRRYTVAVAPLSHLLGERRSVPYFPITKGKAGCHVKLKHLSTDHGLNVRALSEAN